MLSYIKQERPNVPPGMQIMQLRAIGWSDKSIAKYTGLPLVLVQQVLGIANSDGEVYL